MSLAAQTRAVPGVVAPARREDDRRRLRAIEAPARRRRPRVLYALVAVAGAVAIGGAQMSLSILTTQTSYQIATLTSQQRELSWQKQMLYDDVAGLSSPQYLAANASALGMVINESPSYLRLSDGAILGSSQAALGASSVDALNRAAVGNALITDTPLVTAPDATIQGAPLPDPAPQTLADGTDAGSTTPVSNTPPSLTDGLPTPSTH